MKNLWKHSGSYLTWTGVIHTAYALAMFGGSYWAMLRAGLVNTGSEGPGFWFLLLGPLLMMFGPLLQHYIRVTERPAPMRFGVSLLIFAAVGCAVYPTSGFWLFVPQAVVIIAANRRLGRQ
ncbi:MAG: DUF6463 family protein [Alistipes sp.]|nr:DUF6463 family protein [Alistipes sp.]